MRLATFNLLHGRSLSDGTVHAERVAAAVADLDADVLGLQEVDRAQPRSGLLDLTAIAADALARRVHRFAAAVVGTPGETWQPWRSDDDNAHPLYGIALISRWPVLRWQITQLPAAPIRSPVYVPKAGLLLLKDEPRVHARRRGGDPARARSPSPPPTCRSYPAGTCASCAPPCAPCAPCPHPGSCSATSTCPAGPARAFSGWRPLARVPTYPSPHPEGPARPRPGRPARRPTPSAGSWQVRAPQAGISDHRPLVVATAPLAAR